MRYVQFLSFAKGYSKTCIDQIDPITNKKMNCRALWANRDRKKLSQAQKINMMTMRETRSKNDPSKSVYDERHDNWYKSMLVVDENGLNKFEQNGLKRRTKYE